MLIIGLFGFTVCRGTHGFMSSYLCTVIFHLSAQETRCCAEGKYKSPTDKGQAYDISIIYQNKECDD